MPADTFKLNGRLSIKPPSSLANATLQDIVEAEVNECMSLDRKMSQIVSLDADAEETVDMGDVAEASLVIIKPSAPIVVSVTSIEGTDQKFTVSQCLILCTTVGAFTAIKLTRQAGLATVVRVILGESV